MYKPINFVKPQQEDAELCDIKPDVSPSAVNCLSGDEAQSFYEDLLGLPSSSYPAPTVSSSPRNSVDKHGPVVTDLADEKEPVNQQPSVAHKRKVSPKDLLSAAQNGQYKELRRILFTRTLDPDVQDAFGWSALHCAAYEGHLSCVRLLLKFGATRDLRDNKGRTALDLARRRKKIRLYRTIKEFGMDAQDHSGGRAQDDVAAEPEITRCTLCGVEFDAEEQQTHESSIVHRAAQQAATDPTYAISEVNVGFRMLEQMGWERERGLGVEGQGRKFPVKTQLKRDREGLGLSTKSSKVTHFDPKDPSAIKNEKPLQTKINRLSTKTSKDKSLERDFRRAFY